METKGKPSKKGDYTFIVGVARPDLRQFVGQVTVYVNGVIYVQKLVETIRDNMVQALEDAEELRAAMESEINA